MVQHLFVHICLKVNWWLLPSNKSGTAAEKPRLVFKLKLPPTHNKEKKPCKVIKDREDENYTKATITISSRDPVIKPCRQPHLANTQPHQR
ncbi:hypothetical protein FH972_013090 [Carpinus fangiana]|uniref:Uncharacterized protein n=1 Tax=Carpinus fangiana TaxID=176857 RepID=A0A5N6R959_9ROSI|nr:hypothetical protein FH972_013090 [Carpinus fangiana]